MGSLKKIRFILESLMLRLGFLVVPILHRRIIRILATVAGHVAYACSRKLRRITLANLDIAFGHTLSTGDKKRIARQSFCTTALVMIDFLWFTRHTTSRMSKYISIDPAVKTHLDTCPIICVTAHFGNWELLSMGLAAAGYNHVAVAAHLKNTYVDPLFGRLRNIPGAEIIEKQGASRKLLKALRNKKHIALVLDQNILPQEGGIFVDFFGLPAPVSSAPAVLSERTGAPVTVMFCMVRADGTYYLYSLPSLDTSAREGVPCEPALKPDKQSAENAVTEMTEAIIHAFEGEIRKHPEQWLWMYKRWKYMAPGMPREAYPFYSRSVENN